MRIFAGVLNKKRENAIYDLVKMFPPHLFNHKLKLYAGNKLRMINDLNKFKDLKIPGHIAYGICFGNRGSYKKIYPYLDHNEFFLYGKPYDSTSVLPDFKRLNKINGNYILIMKKGDNLLISKDKIGNKQLNYGENSNIAAFSSRIDSLRAIGIRPTRLEPGETIKFSLNGIIKVGIKEMEKPKITILKEKTAVERYKTELVSAVKKRVKNLKKVGIIYSSGVDSALIAKVASVLNVKVICYTAGVAGSPDTINTELYAKEIGLQIKINKLNIKNIESLLPIVINVIENWNQLQVEVAIPIFYAMQAAAKDGIKVVMTGEIADELFAGHDWYPLILKVHDRKELNERMWQDLMLGSVEHAERENKIAEFFDLELSNPYSDENIIKTAMKISVDLKTKENDIMGKYIHRKVSEELNVPLSISWREKIEAQYGSGIHDVVKHLAFKNGYCPDDKFKLKIKTKKLGSVYRYGNKYRLFKKRFGNDNVQKYFEDIAIDLGITN